MKLTLHFCELNSSYQRSVLRRTHSQARRGHIEGVEGHPPKTLHAFIAICFPMNVGKVGSWYPNFTSSTTIEYFACIFASYLHALQVASKELLEKVET